jgi:outer membrane protein
MKKIGSHTAASRFAVALALTCLAVAAQAQAQSTIVKLGVLRYDTSSKSSGIVTSPPLPALAGSDASTGDATTLLLVFERTLTPHFSVELALGIPPRIKAQATGPLEAFLAANGLSREVLSAKNVSPTLLANYNFGAPGDTWRPYVGAGLNYTRFAGKRSSLPTTSLKMSDSWGLALQAGVNYALDRQWGLFASVARVDVKSDVTAVATIPGVPVPVSVTTSIDFRPWTYQAGASYRF